LGAVAYVTLGKIAVPVITVTLAIGCLATAVILTSLFVDFLRHDIAQKKIPRQLAILLTLIVTFFVAQIGFSGINQILGFLLEIIYPGLIVYAIGCILSKVFPMQPFRYTFWVVIFLGGYWKFQTLFL
jgi:LIVCS family branched-chain amino acid:cation transporter